jgi:5-methylcytosine-specific restriction endonuclease McrA
MKTCKICQKDFPATTEYFNLSASGKYLNSYCKPCTSKKAIEYAKNNPHIRAKILEKNKDKRRIQTKIYREKNKEKISELKKAWTKANPHRANATKRRYRVSKRNGIVEKYTDDQVLAKYGTDCYLCQEPIDLNIPRTEPKGLNIEHVIPIVKGGPDTLENVRPSHRNCNLSKHDKDLEEFLRHRETVKG